MCWWMPTPRFSSLFCLPLFAAASFRRFDYATRAECAVYVIRDDTRAPWRYDRDDKRISYMMFCHAATFAFAAA